MYTIYYFAVLDFLIDRLSPGSFRGVEQTLKLARLWEFFYYGTVTATTSVRYGDISGPPRAHQLELRASWTATTLELGPHVQAFCEVLEHAAGLPPAGVTDLGSRTRA